MKPTPGKEVLKHADFSIEPSRPPSQHSTKPVATVRVYPCHKLSMANPLIGGPPPSPHTDGPPGASWLGWEDPAGHQCLAQPPWATTIQKRSLTPKWTRRNLFWIHQESEIENRRQTRTNKNFRKVKPLNANKQVWGGGEKMITVICVTHSSNWTDFFFSVEKVSSSFVWLVNIQIELKLRKQKADVFLTSFIISFLRSNHS